MVLRVGVLGAGYFAALHHEAWTRVPGARLVAVADRDASRARDAAGRHGARAFDGIAAMLDAGVDLLDVAVPPDAHADAIRAGLGAGLRGIVCQKPFCLDRATARAVTAEAEAAGVPLIVHENFRFQPWWRRIRDAVARGAVGTPTDLCFRLRPGDGQGPDAYLSRQPYFQRMPRFLLRETGVHAFDLFRYVLGPAAWVQADLRRLNPVIAGEDAGHVLFGHGDARSLLDGNRLVDHPADDRRRTMGEAWVEGTGGVLTLTGDGAVRLRARGDTEARVVLPPGGAPTFGGDCVHALQSHVAAHLSDGAPVENRARDYLAVLDMEAAAYDSAASGRRVRL